MPNISENVLRDLLVHQLETLEQGLTLVSKEAYLPNVAGTKSFIDILAIDASGRYVLIELKRSDEASREAIHEIYKYVEAAKSYLGARDDEIRVILVSTEWKELLVPFSRFASDTEITVKGLLLKIGPGGKFSSKTIELLPIANGRYIAPWYDVSFYRDVLSLERGIKSYETTCKKKGIYNFVLVILKALPGCNERAHAVSIEAYKNIMASARASVSDEEIANFGSRLVSSEYAICFAMCMMTRAEGLALIADQTKRHEIEEIFTYSEEEGLSFLHRTLSSMDPRPHHDRYEIGSPAKLRTILLSDTDWAIDGVKRYGILKRNLALSDESITDELSGSDGSSGQRLDRTINISDASQFRSIKNDVRTCLRDNPRWQGQILRILDEILLEFPNASVKTHIYNPCCGLITLYLMATMGPIYMPSYYIHINKSNQECVFVGFLHFQPPAISFTELIRKYYSGTLWGLLLTLNWGGYESRDTDIMEDIGLFYRTARIDNPLGNRQVSLFRDERWYREHKSDILNGLENFFRTEQEFIETVVHEISERWDGSFVSWSNH